jgi:hypothetical protein
MSLQEVQFQVSGLDLEGDDRGACYTRRMINRAARPAGDGTGILHLGLVSAGRRDRG